MLCVVSWHHIELVRLDKVNAVVYQRCVGIVSRLSSCSLVLTVVVPVQCDPDVSCSSPIAGEFVMLLKSVF